MPKIIPTELTTTRAVRQSTRTATVASHANALAQATVVASKKSLKRSNDSLNSNEKKPKVVEQAPGETVVQPYVQPLEQVAPPAFSAAIDAFFSAVKLDDKSSEESSYTTTIWRGETVLVPTDTSALFAKDAASDNPCTLFGSSSSSTSIDGSLTPEQFEQEFNVWANNDFRCK